MKNNVAKLWSLASLAPYACCLVAGSVATLLFACGTSDTADHGPGADALSDAAVAVGSQDGAPGSIDGAAGDGQDDAGVCTPIAPARIPKAAFSFQRAMVNPTTGGYVVLGGREVIMLDVNGKVLASGTTEYVGHNETVTGFGYSPAANEHALAIGGATAAIDHFDANGLFNSRSVASGGEVYLSRMAWVGKTGVLAFRKGNSLYVDVEDGKGFMTGKTFTTNQVVVNLEIATHAVSQNIAVAWMSRSTSSGANNDTLHVLVRTPAGTTPYAEFTSQTTGINNEGLALTAVDDGWIVLWQSSTAGASGAAHLATDGSLIKRAQGDFLGPTARPTSVLLTHERGRTLLSYHSMDFLTMFTREVNDAAMTVGPEMTMMQVPSNLLPNGNPTAIASPGGGITVLWGIDETLAFGRICN